MDNIDKGLTVPKVRPKIPQMPKSFLPNLSAQAQKFWISMKKSVYLAFDMICKSDM
jgi:hypothetical protein